MKKKNYMGVWIFSMIFMLSVGVFSYIRQTYADFNGLTGNISIILIKVTYSSNYPDNLNANPKIRTHTDVINSSYFIEDIMFDSPSVRYVFYEWNTKEDGSGESYKIGKFYRMEENLTLYAIWGRNILGDINLDGIVNLDDSKILSKYIGDTSKLVGVVLSNADVNLDEKVDLIDIDIIKNAALGTQGYKGLLSNEPVFIYEIYKPSNGNSNSGNNSGTGNGGGNSSTNQGSGSGSNNFSSSGSTNNGNNSSGESNLGNNDNQNNIDNNLNDDNIDDEINDVEKEDNSHSNLWIFIVGISLVSLIICIDIIKNTIKKNKEN